MDNAVWIFLALPVWYFSTMLSPLAGGWLTAIPTCGAVCLALGLGLAARRKDYRLWLFLVPFVATEAFVAFAGSQRGQVTSPDVIIWMFLGGQLALALGLVVHARRTILPAIALALYSLSYALFAGFVAGMSFTDNWL